MTRKIKSAIPAGKIRLLLRSAKKALKHAYAPYSSFHVGAAVLTDSGRIYTGSNVENASYGLSLCAERVAVFRAIHDGARKIKAVAIASNSPRLREPCGACLQVIAEFAAPDAVIYTPCGNGVSRGRPWKEFLPFAFRLRT